MLRSGNAAVQLPSTGLWQLWSPWPSPSRGSGLVSSLLSKSCLPGKLEISPFHTWLVMANHKIQDIVKRYSREIDTRMIWCPWSYILYGKNKHKVLMVWLREWKQDKCESHHFFCIAYLTKLLHKTLTHTLSSSAYIRMHSKALCASLWFMWNLQIFLTRKVVWEMWGSPSGSQNQWERGTKWKYRENRQLASELCIYTIAST